MSCKFQHDAKNIFELKLLQFKKKRSGKNVKIGGRSYIKLFVFFFAKICKVSTRLKKLDIENFIRVPL